MNQTDTLLSIQSLNKWFDDLHVLSDVSLTVNNGEKIVICGPSGSGKSTLIRCINGIESFKSGKIFVSGHPMTDNPDDQLKIQKILSQIFQIQRSVCPS